MPVAKSCGDASDCAVLNLTTTSVRFRMSSDFFQCNFFDNDFKLELGLECRGMFITGTCGGVFLGRFASANFGVSTSVACLLTVSC